eukprot:9620732-Alexandrium_andersonii.AAC.1
MRASAQSTTRARAHPEFGQAKCVRGHAGPRPEHSVPAKDSAEPGAKAEVRALRACASAAYKCGRQQRRRRRGSRATQT